jgi:hypothetical protein
VLTLFRFSCGLGQSSFQSDVLTIICTFWDNCLEFLSIFGLTLLLTMRKTQSLGYHNRNRTLKRRKIQKSERFKIRGRKLLLFLSILLPLFSLSLSCVSFTLFCCLLPHGRLNYPLLGFRICNWYLYCFDLNYIVILMIILFWSLFVIYLCIIW